jgi:hypothetical protein
MKVMILNFVKFAACMVLVVGLSVSASASCGDSLSAMAAGAASVQSQFRPIQPDSTSAADHARKSMVGLWHIQFDRRSNHPRSVPTLECRGDRGSQPEC